MNELKFSGFEKTIPPDSTKELKETQTFENQAVEKGENEKDHISIIPDQNTPEELEEIQRLRHNLKNIENQNNLHPEFITENNNPTEKEIIIDGKEYHTEYVPKEKIYPAYGYGDGNEILVRKDLPLRIKKFVKAHELYHCQDKAEWGGWMGQEIRANIIPGLKDPIGLAATIFKTITDIDRLKFYLKRFKEKA